jgi:spermidine synthase
MSAQHYTKWQWLQSYFTTVILHEVSSAHNPVLSVALENGELVLNGQTVNLSHGSLKAAFDAVFEAYHLAFRPMENVLVLGLGVGSIPQLLAQHQRPYRIVGIEHDPEVIALGEQFFGLREYAGLEIVVSDVVDYVHQAAIQGSNTIDCIAVDVFVESTVPEQLNDTRFLQGLRSLLSDKGLIIFNRLHLNAETQAATATFEAAFQQVFPQFERFKASDNVFYIYDTLKDGHQ